LQFPWVDPRTDLKEIVEKAPWRLWIEQEKKLKAQFHVPFPEESFSEFVTGTYHRGQQIATKKSPNPLKKLQFLTKFGLPADFVLDAKP
jgi:hypothetical protein